MPDRLIVALDTDTAYRAERLADALSGVVRVLKVGMTLFYAEGPGIVGRLRGLGFDVFLDLKLHDIPHQAAGAARSLTALEPSMLTVHASGGRAMLAAVVDAVARASKELGVPRPKVLAVTVLTSLDRPALDELGLNRPVHQQVALLAHLARSVGVDGVVCSPEEIVTVREVVGPEALVVTPGVRPAWATKGDQARVATPLMAIEDGASHLVVGRPITDADDPRAAAERIIAEITRPDGI